MKSPLRLANFMASLLVVALCGLGADAQAPNFAMPADQQETHPAVDRTPSPEGVIIPGPLRSFLRMAGISQKASLDEVMPLLARNIYVQGYVGWEDNRRPTEFLVLLGRYVNQAKELATIAGPTGTIQVPTCEQALPLLRILGYRLRQQCNPGNITLVTAEPERAFLTIDSGFPLSALEEDLRRGREFSYHYPATRVPVLFSEAEWKQAAKAKKKAPSDLINLLIHEPGLARLYWAISRTDEETRTALAQRVGLGRLLPLAPALDFYGNQICIRSGRVQVPGGSPAEDGWKDLVGARPDEITEFVPKLLEKDKGWLAAFYDSLSRVSEDQQSHFADSRRLREFYAAFHGPANSNAARPAFRLAPGLLLLLTRLQWEPDGQPYVPGNLDVWKTILKQKSEYAVVRDWSKRSGGWTQPDQLLQAMFGFSRLEAEDTPLQMYLLFSELDARRGSDHRLKPDTLLRMAKRFEEYSDQYLLFAEFPELNDDSIVRFIDTADGIDRMSNHTLRGNAMGTFEANVGLWQILARQRQLPHASLNESWQQTIAPFAKLNSETELFDSGRHSIVALFQGITGRPSVSQDEIIEALAGPRQNDPEAQIVHQELARGIRSVMDGQRLVSLDTLMTLGSALEDPARTAAEKDALLPLMGELREFQMPRPIFSSSERNEWAAGIYNNRHTDIQMQTDLAKLLKASPTRGQLDEARGELAPFLRDTLVGLNYAYYEPPGAQLMRTDPLFVRSHDFAGETVAGVEGLWRAPQLFGEGVAAGGGAHLVGSLADLPYVLSEAEQDFIAPENVQALIWREAVPGLLTSAVLPRWWNVSKNELHAVNLYQRTGEELLNAGASNAELSHRLIAILSDRMLPGRASRLQELLAEGRAAESMSEVTPADTLYLAAEYRRRYPNDTSAWGSKGQELAELVKSDPAETNWDRLSRDFGVPHPTLTQDYAQELLNVRPFPAFSGYSSRLMAECWESNNLYWARLADEANYPPSVLNLMAPELTRRMVAKIFATDFEDWPALLRAMRETGDEFRQGKIIVLPTTSAHAVPGSMQ